MTEQTPTTPERIDLARADDPRDVIHRVVACLAQGGVVALPTEAGPGLAASALRPEAVARLQALAGREGAPDLPVPLALKEPAEALDWAPGLSTVGRRLAGRAWPGPVTLLVEGGVSRGLARRLAEDVRAVVTRGESLALRVPANPLFREVLRLTPGPVLLAVAGPASGAEADLILEGPSARSGAPPTVVRVGAEGWSIASAGAVDEATLTRHCGTLLLFICTGNTCRSPMAEALCKRMLAERLGCRADALEANGYVVRSAGLAAARGQRATPDAAEAVRDRGATLEKHASRPATPEMVSQADLILTMTHDHRDALLAELPDSADRIRLLDPDGEDIPDPIGMDRATYRYTAGVIEAHLADLMVELGL